jgi:hypothetical protein
MHFRSALLGVVDGDIESEKISSADFTLGNVLAHVAGTLIHVNNNLYIHISSPVHGVA